MVVTAENRMRRKLRAGELVLGVCNTYPASGIIESLAPGWDYVWIDGQHGEHSYDSLLHAVQAASVVDVDTVIRVPSMDGAVLGPCADIGPTAIMVPMVDTAEHAEGIVQQLRFPPLGSRSFGGRRVVDVAGRDYHKVLDLVVWAQIETPAAVANAQAVIDVEGIDVLFFGADDFKLRMGLPMDAPAAETPEIREALAQVAEAARAAGKHSGCVAADPDTLKCAVDLGYQVLVCASDSGAIRSASVAARQMARDALA